MSFEQDGVRQITVDELKEVLKVGSATVIDVRTEEEYSAGHIPNVPLKPMQEVMDWMDELNPDTAYVFICRSGSRSQKVATFLKQQGFQDVTNFNGGMLSWDGDLTTE